MTKILLLLHKNQVKAMMPPQTKLVLWIALLAASTLILFCMLAKQSRCDNEKNNRFSEHHYKELIEKLKQIGGEIDEEVVGADEVFCPSLPKEVRDKLPFLPDNPDTSTPKTCIQFSGCAWCDRGRATDIKILGKEVDDFKFSDFCWSGNAFKLTNNTFIVGNSQVKIVCDKPPRWKQAVVPGVVALILFFGGIGLVASCCACCLAAAFASAISARRQAYERL
eukprot:GEZU01010080.1.p1 GENE.GEZU01010080.1~~GEZU01010080.1.p1  ORF type:complete len:223 (+),score=36.86 GEZU01010080.1:141-809(+)